MDSTDILDDKDSGPEVQINLPSSVMSRIEELMGGTEQFDSDEVCYIFGKYLINLSVLGSVLIRTNFLKVYLSSDSRKVTIMILESVKCM